MDVSWKYKLTGDQRSNPVIWNEMVELKDVFVPTELDLRKVFKCNGFKNGSSRLKAWGRGRDNKKFIYKDDPHWIAVLNGTPLHTDPPYPRYSHHLKIRVDLGLFVRGLDKVELKLERGLIYALDTHSPHQVFNKSKGWAKHDGWNVAVSFDSDRVWDKDEAVALCLQYIDNAPFIPV